jgi:2-keto-4-pentenoate hydratase/2-oxohepta-3-ene-1,7-dioic acid hydratase in catechol pathway
MRFITFQDSTGPAVAVGMGLGQEFVPLPGQDLLSLIQRGEAGLEQARAAWAAGGPRLPAASLTLLAPIPAPQRNIFCLGWNYAEHSRETAQARGREAKLPERPVFFTKATTSINGPFGDIPFDARVSEQIDWEVELGVVLGAGGKNIHRDEALEHVFGYTVINDVSARDVQSGHGGQFFKGKSLDGYCPMGPWLVTRDEIPDPHHLRLRCLVNGVVKQDSTTAELIFNVPAIIEWLSLGLTLLPGDIIATGTPAGVGFARKPPEFLKPGDVVQSEVEGIGVMRNRVCAV